MRPIIPAAAARALHESMSILGKRRPRDEVPEEPPRRRRRPRNRNAVPLQPTVNIHIPETYDTSADQGDPALLGFEMEEEKRKKEKVGVGDTICHLLHFRLTRA